MLTIGISLMFALVFCVAATAFAVSSAAQGMIPAMQGIANLAVAVGLAMASMGLIGYVGSGEYARDISWLLRSNELWMIVSLFVLGGMASCTLSGLTAASFLAHAYENKSSGFRLFLFGFIAVAYGWIATFVPASARGEVYIAASMAMLLGATVFGIFMVTEQRGLSPRVKAHVPRNPVLAMLTIPLLPGRHRGFLCYLLVAGVLGLTAFLIWPSGSRLADEMESPAIFAVSYAVIFLSIGTWVRGKLPASVQGNHLGRFAIPFIVFLFCIVPVLIDVFVQGGVRQWHIGHAMNPFWTIAEFSFRSANESVLRGVAIAAAVAIALQLPGIIGAGREVMRASARRRELAAQKLEANPEESRPAVANPEEGSGPA